MPVRVYTFIAGSAGAGMIEKISPVKGQTLSPAGRLDVLEGSPGAVPGRAVWILRGATGSERYTTKSEHALLAEKTPPLGRQEAVSASLIPVKKSEAWWDLSQDERRTIFEERSKHIAIGLRYLPAVARRLLHSRELGEPFDFLTWFEYAPAHAEAFEELVGILRRTEE